jgi:hypothetical protein
MIEMRLVEYEWTSEDGQLGCTKERLEYRWYEDLGNNNAKITEWTEVPVIKLGSDES